MTYGGTGRTVEHECEGHEATLVKNLCTGGYKAAGHAKGLTQELKREMKTYKKGDDLFCYDAKLPQFSTAALLEEAKEKMPLLYTVITGSSRKNKAKHLKAKEALPLSAFLSTWILQSNFTYRNDVLLRVGSCKGEVIEMFQRQGLCSHKNTVTNMMEKVANSFDKELRCWKEEISTSQKQVLLLKESMDSLPAPEDEGMEVSTIVFSKDTLKNCTFVEEETFNQCQNMKKECAILMMLLEQLNISRKMAHLDIGRCDLVSPQGRFYPARKLMTLEPGVSL